MKIQQKNHEQNRIVDCGNDTRTPELRHSLRRKPKSISALLLALVTGLFVLFSTTLRAAEGIPPGCSADIQISLHGDMGVARIGDTIRYDVNIMNGHQTPRIVGCQATNIHAWVTTPDGVVHPMTLLRTTLNDLEYDSYPSVVSYIIRAIDVKPNGRVESVANVTAAIMVDAGAPLQGGAFQPDSTMVTLPCIGLTASCTPGVGEGAITITGVVTNCGNTILTGVVVTNLDNNGILTVTPLPDIQPGGFINFSGAYVPFNPCVVSTVIVQVKAIDTSAVPPTPVEARAETACGITLTPGIKVTKLCPANPTPPGSLLVFSGSVSNSGNVTLTNVVVVDNQPAPNTPVFNKASLAVGEVANFTGSYTAPFDCTAADTLTATATSRCGANVSDSASATCQIATMPGMVLTMACDGQPQPGGVLAYSGSISNSGNITLTNVIVVNDHSGAVLGPVTLTPGAILPFNGRYQVPADCETSSTSTGTGVSLCGVGVTNSARATCPISNLPQIAIVQSCPPNSAVPGGIITFSGTVSNPGTVGLTNVTVVSDQPAPGTVVFTAASLPVGVSSNFTASFTAGSNLCSVTETLLAIGTGLCGGSAVTNSSVTTCPLITTPGVTVSLSCPTQPVINGGPITYNGTVKNTGDVTLTNVVVVDSQASPSTVLTVPTMAPGASAPFTASFIVPINVCMVSSTATATGTSICTGASVTNSARADCSLITTSRLVVTENCPTNPIVPGGPLTYSGSVSNAGDIALTNVVVVSSQNPAAPVLTVPLLAAGQVTNFTSTSQVPFDVCSVTSTLTAVGQEICGGGSVTNAATATCRVSVAPSVTVNLSCPTAPIFVGGLVTYTGTVNNNGNITLTNVVVVDSQYSPVTVLTVPTLAPGASANFTVSFNAPSNACSVSTTVIATGNSTCTEARVGSSDTKTCPLITTPRLLVTENCPGVPAQPGGLLLYSGSVSNIGDIALTNVVVVNDRSGAVPVLTVALLQPGEGTNFSGSYTVPLGLCSVTATLTASAADVCTGRAVTNSATATCPLTTTPRLFITYDDCPSVPCAPGSFCDYSGSVSNAGNITLTNVMVANDHSGIPILVAATLPPGAVSNFTGSYFVPANAACSIATSVTASGFDVCVGTCIYASASHNCPLLTRPGLQVVEVCPSKPTVQGGTVTYQGTVRNTGNTTLTNIVVVNNRPSSGTVVFSVASLTPGASASFTGSYIAPSNCCVVWSTLLATGTDVCFGQTVTDSDTAACTVLTTPRIVVTKVCPTAPVEPGAAIHYSGTVSNAGDIALIQVSVATGQGGSASPVLGPITLAPGQSVGYTASFAVPQGFCTWREVVTATGKDACTLASVTGSAASECPVVATPRIAVTKECPTQPTPKGGVYTFTGRVSNVGNVTLTNVIVVDNEPSNNTPVIGPITLAPGASTNFSGSYIAPTCCCFIIDTLTATGQDQCVGTVVEATASAACPLLTTPSIAVSQNCPEIPVPVGGLYVFTGSVINTGDVALTDVFVYTDQPASNTLVLGPISLAPGESQDYIGSYLVTACCQPLTNIVTASGIDICQERAVNARAACFGNHRVIIGGNGAPPPAYAGGVFSLSFGTQNGVLYTVQYKDSPGGSDWNYLESVPGTGGVVTVTDSTGGKESRFYRVVSDR